mgnify:CR=1 FL=1
MSTNAEQKAAELRRDALDYHQFPTPGKVAIHATKQMVNQRDLALAYSPGVAFACEEIVADPARAVLTMATFVSVHDRLRYRPARGSEQ